MFQSTLLRRTMSLVIISLVASAILATLAFIVAGRTATIDIETTTAVNQDIVYQQLFMEDPGILDNEQSRNFFFNTSFASGHDYFLISQNGKLLQSTPTDKMNITVKDINNVNNTLNFKEFTAGPNGISTRTFDTNDPMKKIIAISQPVYYNGEYCTLLSLSYLNAYNDLIIQYINILVLSTLMAACVMLIPAYALVARMILPIQEMNEIAMEYASGNFSVRADESHKGEIGELGASFNYLADQLSKSISDLTNEKNRLQEIFDVISDGIVVVDSESNPITTNEAIKTLFSRADKNNMFTEHLQLIPFEEVWKDFDDCISTGETKTRMIEDRSYAYQSTIIPKYDSEDKTRIIGATGFFRDIYEAQKNEHFRQDYVANISHELRTPLHFAKFLCLVQALHINFAYALAAAHHVRRIYGLVGGNHHKLLNTVFHAQVRQYPRTVYIVQDSLGRVVLHHGNMLVSGRMEHEFRLERLEDILHPDRLADTRHYGLGIHPGEFPGHHQADVVLGGLGLVDKHHCRRLELRHLTHDLAAYGTRRAGNKHPLALELFRNHSHIHSYLLARQQVLDIHGLEVPRHACFPLIGGRHHVNLCPGGYNIILQHGIGSELLGTERRHKHRLHVESLDDGCNIGVRRIYLLAHKARITKRRVVGDEAFQAEAYGLFAAYALGEGDASGLDAENHRILSVIRLEISVIHIFYTHAHHPHHHCRKACHDYYMQAAHHHERMTVERVRPVMDAHQKGCCAQHGIAYPLQIYERREAQDAGIGMEYAEKCDMYCKKQGNSQQQFRESMVNYSYTRAKPVDYEPAGRDNQGIHDNHAPVRQRRLGKEPV